MDDVNKIMHFAKIYAISLINDIKSDYSKVLKITIGISILTVIVSVAKACKRFIDRKNTKKINEIASIKQEEYTNKVSEIALIIDDVSPIIEDFQDSVSEDFVISHELFFNLHRIVKDRDDFKKFLKNSANRTETAENETAYLARLVKTTLEDSEKISKDIDKNIISTRKLFSQLPAASEFINDMCHFASKCTKHQLVLRELDRIVNILVNRSRLSKNEFKRINKLILAQEKEAQLQVQKQVQEPQLLYNLQYNEYPEDQNVNPNDPYFSGDLT